MDTQRYINVRHVLIVVVASFVMDTCSNSIVRHAMTVVTNSHKKIQSREGLMKKVFLVSLLLGNILLIGSSGTALAQCMDYQDYYCTFVAEQYGEVANMDADCITLCYDDWFEVGIDDAGGYNESYGYLYPAPDNKHLLGTCYDYFYGWGGGAVGFKGVSMILTNSLIQDGTGLSAVVKCTPCNGCCH